MGFFKTLYRNRAHFVVLTDFDNQGRDVYLRFDTGAVCTVISIELFVAEKIDKTKFIQQIKSRANRRIFHSATGNQMEGYLVCAENIKMSGACLSKFFYYLIVDMDERVGLLGDDFISKSRFMHEVDQEIEVDSFDDEKYAEGFTRFISEKEMYEILELCILEQ